MKANHIYFTDNFAIFGTGMLLKDFPQFLERHRENFPNTSAIEIQGKQLRQADFPNIQMQAFVRAVCEWGGHSGIGGRILKRNGIGQIRSALLEATHQLDLKRPDCRGALHSLNQLDSLGAPSFASKHLRFLRPDLCPVFDSILRVALPYQFNPDGYGDFATDCLTLADRLKQENVHNPLREGSAWFAADVEAALYVHARDRQGA